MIGFETLTAEVIAAVIGRGCPATRIARVVADSPRCGCAHMSISEQDAALRRDALTTLGVVEF